MNYSINSHPKSTSEAMTLWSGWQGRYFNFFYFLYVLMTAVIAWILDSFLSQLFFPFRLDWAMSIQVHPTWRENYEGRKSHMLQNAPKWYQPYWVVRQKMFRNIFAPPSFFLAIDHSFYLYWLLSDHLILVILISYLFIILCWHYFFCWFWFIFASTQTINIDNIVRNFFPHLPKPAKYKYRVNNI